MNEINQGVRVWVSMTDINSDGGVCCTNHAALGHGDGLINKRYFSEFHIDRVTSNYSDKVVVMIRLIQNKRDGRLI